MAGALKLMWIVGGHQKGTTPMLLATVQGYAACVEALARHGADVNTITVCQHRAQHSGQTAADSLVRQRDWTLLFFAARYGRAECLDALARHGADVNEAMPVCV